mgnify:CR=1 FL=1
MNFHSQRIPVAGGESVVVMAPEPICVARAEAERPPEWQGYIKNWFGAWEPSRPGRDRIIWTAPLPAGCSDE